METEYEQIDRRERRKKMMSIEVSEKGRGKSVETIVGQPLINKGMCGQEEQKGEATTGEDEEDDSRAKCRDSALALPDTAARMGK